jgi:acetyl-CoA carboxylase biotin carboxyl carrier protein
VEENQLRQLIRLLKEEALTEITVCEGDERITVRQAIPGGEPLVERRAKSAIDMEREAEAADGTFALSAPLVGTFYSRPTPESEPFVSSGATVATGDVVGIIEAMKVMNEVRAERPGKVRRLLVADGDAVEYGQELVLFEQP